MAQAPTIGIHGFEGHSIEDMERTEWSAWIDRSGKVYAVKYRCHDQFAEYVLDSDAWVLVTIGWLHISGGRIDNAEDYGLLTLRYTSAQVSRLYDIVTVTMGIVDWRANDLYRNAIAMIERIDG